MDNEQNSAPVIPAGTNKGGGMPSYDPLIAATLVNNGQADNSPDLGEQENNDSLTSELKAPIGTTFEELAAKKGFKSPEDMAKAYINLESQNKRVEMGLAELSKVRDNQSMAELGIDTSQVATQEDAIKIVEKVVRKFTRPLEDKLALTELFYKNPDAQQYATQMAKVVKENPGVGWDVAYRAAKFDALEQKAKEQGKQEAYQAIQQKKTIAVENVKSSTKDSKSLSDLIQDKSVPFSEVQRIMRERFRQ